MVLIWSNLYPRYEDRMRAMAMFLPSALWIADSLTLEPKQ